MAQSTLSREELIAHYIAMPVAQVKKIVADAVENHSLDASWSAPAKNQSWVKFIEELCSNFGLVPSEDGSLVQATTIADEDHVKIQDEQDEWDAWYNREQQMGDPEDWHFNEPSEIDEWLDFDPDC